MSQAGANSNTGGGGSGGITWHEMAGAISALAGNGYFITGTSTATLPPAPSEGDTVDFVVDTTQILTIVASPGQSIRVGLALSAVAGMCANTARGDSIELVYKSTGSTWFSLSGIQGIWAVI